MLIWLFLHAVVILCFAVLLVYGVVILELYRRKRRAKKKALIKLKPVFSEYKYVYRNIKED